MSNSSNNADLRYSKKSMQHTVLKPFVYRLRNPRSKDDFWLFSREFIQDEEARRSCPEPEVPGLAVDRPTNLS